MIKWLYLFLFFGIGVFSVVYASQSWMSSHEITYSNAHYTVLDTAFSHVAVSAAAYSVFDVETGEPFGAKNPNDRHEMASVTKLITADTALSTSTVDSSTTVSWRAVRTEGKSGSLRAGEQYHVRELLFPLLLESSNDAAEAIAEKNGRARFIGSMNARVKDLGMSSTTIVDPSGLSPKNVSTAHDLSTLLTYLIRDHRHILDITTLATYVGATHTWQNIDPVVSSKGFIGGKHGYTDTAGRTLAVVFDERVPGSNTTRSIGVVLLDSDNLQQDVERLRTEFRRAVSYGYDIK